MRAVAEKETLVEEIIDFNGPEDDADDVYDDDFELEEMDSIEELDDFDDDGDDF